MKFNAVGRATKTCRTDHSVPRRGGRQATYEFRKRCPPRHDVLGRPKNFSLIAYFAATVIICGVGEVCRCPAAQAEAETTPPSVGGIGPTSSPVTQNTSTNPGQLPARTQSQNAGELYPVERNLIEYVNQERARFGLPALKVCPELQRSARSHCRWMAATGILRHTADPVAENIAMGYETSRHAVAGWMSSPGHRANILGPYRYIGAAAYLSPRGTPFWCLQFRR